MSSSAPPNPRAFLSAAATPLEHVAELRRGFLYGTLEHLAGELDMSVTAAAAAIGLPSRTLARRKKAGDRLSQLESERVARLGRMLATAQRVLGSNDKAKRWMREPNRALDGRPPIELLDTDVGTEAVSQILGRIEHGVFS